MPDILGESSDWFESQCQTHRTRAVIYKRGAVELEINAEIGRTLFEHDRGEAGIVREEVRDYFIRASDLGALIRPEERDQIIEDLQFTYEVLSQPGLPPWEWSDVRRRTLRIHTKLASNSQVAPP